MKRGKATTVIFSAGVCGAADRGRTVGRYRRCILLLLAFFIFLLSQSRPADASDGKTQFRDGKAAFDAGRYDEAEKAFSSAQQTFPLLGDYALLYLSDSRHNLGDHEKALESLRLLIKRYPSSPLVKAVRTRIVRESRETMQEGLDAVYRDFLADYPADAEISYAYAVYLKKAGRAGEAKPVFKDLYLRAGAYAGPAQAELTKEDVSVGDLIERASNLSKRYSFRAAEKELRQALNRDDGSNHNDIVAALAKVLFNQKRYSEAAVLFAQVKDLYSSARSQFRAGDDAGFAESLSELLKTNDRRASDLLVARASDKRRAKQYDEAIALYQDALRRFPPEREDILWGMGWTYYLSGNYEKAAGTFEALWGDYGDPQYLYWQARSVEASGKDAARLYKNLVKTGDNFYTILAYVRGKVEAAKPVALRRQETLSKPDGDRRFQRVDALIDLGMTAEATRELVALSRDTETPEELGQVITKLHDLGEFSRSIRLVTRTPYSESMHRYWYPLAFWDEVTTAAKLYGLDPMILLAVMREESRFDASAHSIAGARGLMQIMPQTAYRLDKAVKLGLYKDSQIEEVRNNISLGAFYLKSLLNEFGSLASVLAAYNAGESAVKSWQQQGAYHAVDEFVEDIPYGETRNYVKKVITSFFQYKKEVADSRAAASFDIILGRL